MHGAQWLLPQVLVSMCALNRILIFTSSCLLNKIKISGASSHYNPVWWLLRTILIVE